MEILAGKVSLKDRRKINEIIEFINTYIPSGLISTSKVTVVTSGANKALSITSTAQTENDLCTITNTTAVTSAALMKAFNVAMTTTGVSTANMIEVARFTLTTAVKNGNWVNAIVGKIDFTTAGYVTGLAGAVCAEIDLPTTNPIS